MNNLELHKAIEHSVVFIGAERVPILVIDNFIASPSQLVDWVETEVASGRDFRNQASDFYPGVRKEVPTEYLHAISMLAPVIKSAFELGHRSNLHPIMSAFSLTTTPVNKLRPIQMLPHFDTAADNQLAMVHYLCGGEHGGTAYYRHRTTKFERINETRFDSYSTELKQQAIEAKLHENPAYVSNNSELFEQIYKVEAKMNRVVIYPSNLLHSGDINIDNGLKHNIRTGRLTISSFIRFI